MATGMGALTFDERHEMMRRRMLRCQPQADSNTALAHLYCGVKVNTTSQIGTCIFLLLF